MDYLHRPLSAFNKYEALKMMDSLQHLAKGTKHELLLPCLPDDTPKNSGQALNCFYCGKEGNFKRWCDTRKRDFAMREYNGASQSATK